MAEDGAQRRRPVAKMRLSQEKRDRFLEVLGQTGNRRLAAEAIRVEARLMDQRREFDPLLDRQWREALEQAHRRLAGASGPLDCIGGAEPMVIRRGAGGRMKMVKAGPRRWSRAVEDRFFAVLATCGNIAAAARAVGFTESCISHRRRKWPDFAQRLEEALEDAEVEIEFRLAAEVAGRRGRVETPEVRPSTSLGTNESCAPSLLAREEGAAAPPPAPPASGRGEFDLDAAMRFLKWREEKRRGGGRRGRVPREPTIEEVTDKIVRKVEAIKRQRARDGGEAERG